MQHMDVPLGGNPLQFSVDITYSHSNWKPNLSTFSDDMQLGSHYRNSNCSFGDTDISYNIGREDIWDGAHSNGSNDKDDEFKEAKDGILETKGSHGVETSSSVKIHEKGESKGAQYRIRNERAKVEEGKAINREDNLNRWES
ncbi:putative G-protein coupled receptor [Gossypium arboreum]|uniref:Putative G-protein coupled receptor n=1 Tax=Gossypium arboreum TaxID=29729 RepID=A0A0B0P1H9_GOSAR|nr:putative G-protein coupled receptor [Gossypium arboreum]